MKLRWLILCDEHGVKTDPELQYNNGDEWECLPIIEMKVSEYHEEGDNE